jgi:hypothetical protein
MELYDIVFVQPIGKEKIYELANIYGVHGRSAAETSDLVLSNLCIEFSKPCIAGTIIKIAGENRMLSTMLIDVTQPNGETIGLWLQDRNIVLHPDCYPNQLVDVVNI